MNIPTLNIAQATIEKLAYENFILREALEKLAYHHPDARKALQHAGGGE